jgi:hypothetical protein
MQETRKSWDLHDDNLLGIQVTSPRKKNELATIHIDLQDDATGGVKRITMSRCTNIRWVMDFNILADNWFAQTNAFTVVSDLKKMKSFVESQRRHWRVKYMHPSSPDNPIKGKLASIRSFRLFQIKFFGGTLEVLAKSVKIKRIAKRTA